VKEDAMTSLTPPLVARSTIRATIRAFVEDFYARVRQHPTLGPVFEERLAGQWDPHLEKLTDFWMTVLCGVAAYKGNPFAAHLKVVRTGKHAMEAAHFIPWLELFEAAARAKLPPHLAPTAIEKAHRIADSLRQGLFFRARQAG
jgi:hemoglobin